MPTYSIDGIIGAGKSTVLKLLRQNNICLEEPVADWGELLENFYEDINRYAYPFQLQVLLSQKKQYDPVKNSTDDIYIERCPETSRDVFFQMLKEDGFFSEKQVHVYNDTWKKIAYKVDHHFILYLPIEQAWARIQKRGRKGEDGISLPYLKNLDQHYRATYENNPNVTWISSLQTPEEIVAEIKAKVNELKKKEST